MVEVRSHEELPGLTRSAKVSWQMVHIRMTLTDINATSDLLDENNNARLSYSRKVG